MLHYLRLQLNGLGSHRFTCADQCINILYAVSYAYHFLNTYITDIVLDLEDPNSVGELQHRAKVLKVHCPEIYTPS